MYPYGFEYAKDAESVYPDTWGEINARLNQPRPCLSPSHFTREVFKDFEKVNTRAESELAVLSAVFPVTTGRNDTPSSRNIKFNHLATLINGDIINAEPHFYDGARPSTIDRWVQKGLGSYRVVNRSRSPLLTGFFAEAKGPDGNFHYCQATAVLRRCIGYTWHI